MREKVLRYILERKLMRAGDRVCVAVSGGADSVALLRVLLELRTELGIVLAVAHFNHGLRAEASDADEAFVVELAKQHDLEFFSSRADVREHALTRKLSLEAAARELRYCWLRSLAESHRVNAVATGHTLDDQAETVLLKFLRGAGTRGLAGIYPEIAIAAKAPTSFQSAERGPEGPLYHNPAPNCFQPAECVPESPPNQDRAHRQPGARIVRPLLGVTRAEVEQYLAALGQTWHEDESNLDYRFIRNRVRHELLPLLEREYNPNLRHVLSDAAELSRAEEEYWQALVERELHDRMAAQRLRLMNFRALPLALQRRLLRRFVETANLKLDFEHIEKLLHCALGELPKAELTGGWLAVRQGGCLELLAPQVEPPFSSYQYTLPVPGEVHIAEIGLTVRCIPVPQEFAKEEPPGSLLCTELLGPELIVRNWRPGDRFWPVHSKSEEKLKRLFSEKHIPAGQRLGWPVVLKGEQIVWVGGLPVARAFAWSGSGDAVKIEMLG
ncbi:MAG: tRNA lysidine(34) synthetase TilS [Candidatus Korobacteraceae bacterium]